MKVPSFRKEGGQSMVHVAILMLVLLAIVSLAIDVGNLYAARRRMQNAADAGALAGAWELCFGNPGNWQTTAEEYAHVRNGAPIAVASQPQDWIVEVDTQEDTQTFLASLAGINTVPITAEAQAGCGTATSLCNIWPISFHQYRWEELECNDVFFVWNDNFLEEDCYLTDPVTGACIPFCEACLCDQMVIDGVPITEGPPDDMALNISSEHRGWLNLPRPEPPYDAPSCADNCGVNQINCWIDQEEGYTGEVTIDPAIAGGPLCLPGEPGVSETVRHHIEDQPGLKINILIWNNDAPNTCTESMVVGTCPGDPYYIVQAGCIEIDPYNPVPNIDIPANPDYFSQPWCVQNVKVVKAKRECNCDSECGSTTGPPVPGGVNSVSLLK